MKLGIGAVSFGPRAPINLDRIRRVEALGFDSAWAAEAYGKDAASTATWILAQTTRIKVGTAIMQIPARTPAMTAMTLDYLSGARFLLGLGPSGPQVVEGWHGVPYGKPLTRMAVKGNRPFSIGGMGARGKDFYNDLTKRLGYEEAAVPIQDLFLAGKKAEAAAAVPDALLDAVHRIGSKDRIRARLAAWKEAGRKGWVHTMNVSTSQPEGLELLADGLL